MCHDLKFENVLFFALFRALNFQIVFKSDDGDVE